MYIGYDGDSCDCEQVGSTTWTPPKIATFAPYPYASGYDGYIRREPRDSPATIGRNASGFVALEGFSLGDGLYGPGFSLGVDYRRVGIESNLDWLVEGMLEDAMYLGSTNARVGLVMQPNGRIVAGAGVQYMVDGRTPGEGVREYAMGANMMLAMELYPVRPLVFSARADLGTLYQALSAKARVDVGVVLRGVGLFAGYQYRNIGGVDMHGPTVGLRLWL